MRIHSLLSPKVAVQSSDRHGQGLFAVAKLEPKEIVAVWGGKVFTKDECRQLATVFSHFATHPVAIGCGYYLGTENLFELDDAEYLNHGCDPNVGIQGQIVVVARRTILPGHELLIDYATLDESPTEFDCTCGSALCRGKVEGGLWKDPDFRARHQEYFSWNLLERLRAETTQQQHE